MSKGEIFQMEQKNYNLFVFVLEGGLVVNASEGLGLYVKKDEFFFLPALASLSMESLSPCHFMIFFFDRFVNPCERSYIRDLYPICLREEYRFCAREIRYPMERLIRDLRMYAGRLGNDTDYLRIKYEELFYILRTGYSKEEMAALFHPIVGIALDLRLFVQSNYLKAKNIYALADLSGMKRKTFDRQFCDEYGQTPYQWVLKQKAKHIRYELSETDDQMQDVMRKYGFTIPPHFTRFCKDYFDHTPLELRRCLRQDKLLLLAEIATFASDERTDTIQADNPGRIG
ncbi:MAG: AraC family transcriptional regulator [Tannerellaceae bacterium]|nr:AraC family transcriptional regulator [Tannerellaceae bacterium]